MLTMTILTISLTPTSNIGRVKERIQRATSNNDYDIDYDILIFVSAYIDYWTPP